ncbi:hypothetical protein EYF80_009770 [Liparis tanakae]|uniref:Uncharacterized protein n=1 Tax=Liparis tanakae TaxID=230148 RepID=A0A4Z2IRY6_9TELE|nr:hypothetical protein EYF80_009770 [Liparis tanakae]
MSKARVTARDSRIRSGSDLLPVCCDVTHEAHGERNRLTPGVRPKAKDPDREESFVDFLEGDLFLLPASHLHLRSEDMSSTTTPWTRASTKLCAPQEYSRAAANECPSAVTRAAAHKQQLQDGHLLQPQQRSGLDEFNCPFQPVDFKFPVEAFLNRTFEPPIQTRNIYCAYMM